MISFVKGKTEISHNPPNPPVALFYSFKPSNLFNLSKRSA